MKRIEMIEALSLHNDVESKAAAERILDWIEETVIDGVANGETVNFSTKFGRFETAKRAATTARVPLTGATVDVPAKTVPKFKASEPFKRAVL